MLRSGHGNHRSKNSRGDSEGGALAAFLGGFILEDFRNAGKGAFCPDWCHGAAGTRASLSYRHLYRELADRWVERGARIHAAAAYDGDAAAMEAFSLTGFGCIVLDAAVDAAELAAGLSSDTTTNPVPRPAGDGIAIRRAGVEDAAGLYELNARLAAHIGESPVFMPSTHGSTAEEWEAWFDETEAVVRGMEIVSVDCETTNIEAYAFWTRRFHPVTWSYERRV